jgi:hypothetical protein
MRDWSKLPSMSISALRYQANDPKPTLRIVLAARLNCPLRAL